MKKTGKFDGDDSDKNNVDRDAATDTNNHTNRY